LPEIWCGAHKPTENCVEKNKLTENCAELGLNKPTEKIVQLVLNTLREHRGDGVGIYPQRTLLS
jgi:hypothetical protein